MGSSWLDLSDSVQEDMVNTPKHYQLFPDLECIDAIKKLLTKKELIGYYKGTILAYRLRAGKKGIVEGQANEDLEKAAVYEKWLGELMK